MSVRNDRGQASLVLVLAVPALLVAALVIISVAGHGVIKRTETSTAADASALAAAEQWRSYVADAIQAADGRHPEDALDRLRALLTTDPTALGGSLVSHRLGNWLLRTTPRCPRRPYAGPEPASSSRSPLAISTR